jgi:cystathionine beta-lyase
MTAYDFTTVVDRSAMGSAKWITMKQANPNVPAGIPPFSVADLDISNAPEIIDGLKDFLNTAVLGYTMATPEYIQSIVDWMKRRHAWSVAPEWITQSAGVVPAFFAAVRAFTEPGEGVIIQTPAYYPFYMAIELAHRTVARNPMVEADGHYGIDFDNLTDLAKDPKNRVLLFCSPHNPTGRVWTRRELERIAGIVCDNDLVLISDEIHFDLVMPGYHHTVFASVCDEIAQRSIICTAPSKTFNLAGMATSNIIIPNEELRAKFTAELTASGFFMPNCLGYEACRLAYTKGEPRLQELIDLIARNHDLVKDYFAKYFPDLHVFDLEGTYLQWIDFRPLGKSADELERINTDRAMVFFDEGKVFGEEGVGFERMNLATPTAAVVAALERLRQVYCPGE